MDNLIDRSDIQKLVREWVETYSDIMYSWAFHKTSNKETAEDLVQESFLAAINGIERFKGESNPKTWLFSILNNKINDHFRALYRKPLSIDSSFLDLFFDKNNAWKMDARPLTWENDEVHLLDNKDFNETLVHCVQKLPQQWNAAVQLKYIEEKNAKHICQELDISPSNFWQIIHRAKLQLRKCLELNWFEK